MPASADFSKGSPGGYSPSTPWTASRNSTSALYGGRQRNTQGALNRASFSTRSTSLAAAATREQAKQAVMDWMAFYNHRRQHSSLGYLSAMQFEQRRY